MKVIIAGTRTLGTIEIIRDAVEKSSFKIDCVLSGGARGVDKMGEVWARENGIPVVKYLAEWKRHGRAAGPIRNQKMVEQADALIAVWDGKSRGTADVIKRAEDSKLKLYRHMVIKCG